MPKLDPSDVDVPTAVDISAAAQANAVNPATTAPVAPSAIKPNLFGGSSNGATTSPTTGFSSGAPAFGASSTGFGAPAFGASSTGFGAPTGGASSTGFGAPTGGFGSSAPTTGFGGGFGSAPSQFGGQQGQNQAIDTSAFSGAIAASAGQEPEHWMKSFWRPAMGWLYMFTCFCDFVAFPVLWSMMQAYIHGAVQQQWNPITLQGAGLYHLAMGAILGIAAYGRTQEKKADKQ